MGALNSLDRLRRELSATWRAGDVVLDFFDVGLGEVATAAGQSLLAVSATSDLLHVIEVQPGGDGSAIDAGRSTALATKLPAVLQPAGARRLLVIAAGEALPDAWEQSLANAAAEGIEVVRLIAKGDTTAADFMPAEDADAVTARLRALGYI